MTHVVVPAGGELVNDRSPRRIADRQVGKVGTAVQDVAEHGGGQGAGGRIALARMVAADQVQDPATSGVDELRVCAVPEGWAWAGNLPAGGGEYREQCLPGEAAEYHDCAQGRAQEFELLGEPW